MDVHQIILRQHERRKALQIDINSLGNMKVLSPHICLNLKVYFSGFESVFFWI